MTASKKKDVVQFAPNVPVEVAPVVDTAARVEAPVTDSVPVAVKLEPVILPLKNPLPATLSVAKGEVVPMPTLPIRLSTAIPARHPPSAKQNGVTSSHSSRH